VAAAAADVDIDPEDPVFQGKVKAMVNGGLPEAFCTRALMACGADMGKATQLLEEVMGSVDGSNSVAEVRRALGVGEDNGIDHNKN
jgi:hypothetical protein